MELGYQHGQGSMGKRETRTCFHCNKVGHLARDCRERFSNVSVYLLPKTVIASQRTNSFARDYFNMAKNNLKVCQGKFNLKKR